MDKQHFKQLVRGVREMKRHVAGKTVRGAKTTEFAVPNVRSIREAAQISQKVTGDSVDRHFARLTNLKRLERRANARECS